MELVQAVIVGVITGLFSAGSVWGVLRTEMKYMRRDIDHAHERIENFIDRRVLRRGEQKT